MRSTLRVETPIVSASSRFCTVARIWRPNELYFSTALSATERRERQHDREELAVRPVVAEHRRCCRRSQLGGFTGSPWAPKMSLATCCRTMATPTVARSVSSGRLYIHWMIETSSSSPRRPATTKATGMATTIERPVLVITCWVT